MSKADGEGSLEDEYVYMALKSPTTTGFIKYMLTPQSD